MSYRTFIGISPFHSTPSLGPLRTELYIYAFARKYGGDVYLKNDDTNPKGQSEEYFRSHLNLLEKCGCSFFDQEKTYFSEDIIFQSKNKEIYRKYFSKLIADRLTSEKNGLVSLDVQALGKYVGASDLVVNDILKGKINFNIAQSGYSYIPLYSIDSDRFFFHLTTVVDEEMMGINLLMRGEDKISVAPIHDLIRTYFQMKIPDYLHLPLLMDATTGKRLRGSEYLIENMLKDFPLQVLVVYTLQSGYLSSKAEKFFNLQSFIDILDYKKIKKRSGNFVPSDLEKIARKLGVRVE